MTTPIHNCITDVAGIQVGHYTDLQHAKGCTVILCPEGAVGGVDVRGTAPGTRETDLLRPGQLVERVHAVLLTGGSAYGLDAAGGVMRYLEERGIGFRMGEIVVPIVPAAVIFDLSLGSARVRPGPEQGYLACLAATSGPIAEGTVGAGTGATVAKTLGRERAVKGGLGTASIHLGDGLMVGAIAVVNAAGDIVEPETGRIIAGPRREDGKGFYNSIELSLQPGFVRPDRRQAAQPQEAGRTNTTLGLVATNAALSKEQVNKMAERGQDGMALAVRPSHTMGDGDTVFSLATGAWTGLVDRNQLQRISNAAATVMARAIIRGVTQATGLAGMPAVRELGT
ncbi:MAG: P1 family peptidase [Chloroflexi bacterium]|nr:P1 family peptidase [Chloroflexota bacterium]